jgi:hypothetical protein
MLRYLQAAFWVRERIPLLGDLPVNVLLLAALLTLGFGHPAFWLIALGAEVGFLAIMVSNERFRRAVDALTWTAQNDSITAQRQQLISRLAPSHRQRLTALQSQRDRTQHYYQQFQDSDPTAADNLHHMAQLEWCFLKLLTAQQHLSEAAALTTEPLLLAEIAHLEAELADATLRTAVRGSKQATLDLTTKRHAALQRRGEALAEIDSDLQRIEAQFDLAAESAVIRAKPSDVSFDIDLTSHLISTPEYLGDNASLVAAIDHRAAV